MTTALGILRLVRASIALTAPADALAGACLAIFLMPGEQTWSGEESHLSATAAALGSSVLFFFFGMAQNDFADREKDRRGQRNRPIPAGLVSETGARLVVLLCGGGALFLASLSTPTASWVAVAMLVTISLYNLAPQHLGMVGPPLLALIRMLNVTLGAAALGLPLAAFPTALATFFYVGAVSRLARMEDGEVAFSLTRSKAFIRVAQVAAILAPALTLWRGADLHLPGILLATCVSGALIMLLNSAVRSLMSVDRSDLPNRVSIAVGTCLSGIFLLDAAIAFASQQPWIGLILVALLPLSRLLVGIFPPS